MRKSIEKKLRGGKEKFGMSFIVDHELNKEAKKVLFPKILEAANELLSRIHPNLYYRCDLYRIESSLYFARI